MLLSPPGGTVTAGQPTNFSATVLCNGVAVSGASVSFNGPGGTLTTGTTDTSGVAVGAVTFATPGATTVTARVTSDTTSACGCTGTDSPAVNVTVQPSSASCSVVLSPPAGTVTVGQATTFSATLQCNGAPVAGAQVAFSDPFGALLAQGTTDASGAVNGAITFATAGPTTVTATVLSDTASTCHCTGSESTPVSVTVQPVQQTCTVTLNPPAGTVTVGQPTTLSATVQCNGVGVSGANVTFTGPGGTLNTGTTDVNGIATASATFTTAGNTSVTATATGGTSTCTCTNVSSTPVNVPVQPQQSCSVVLFPPAGTVTVGQATTFSATLQCNGAPVAGAQVAFSDPFGALLAQGTTDASGAVNGAITFATAGPTTVTATVLSDTASTCHCTGSESTPVSVTVQPAQQTCTVALSPPVGTVTVGQPADFGAVVLCSGAPVVGAVVAFSDPFGALLAQGTTDASGAVNGAVTFTAAGPTTVTATVVSSSGTACTCVGVASSPVNVTVQPQQSCTVTLSPPVGTVTAGQPTNFSATVLCNGVAVVGATVSFTGPGGTLLGGGVTDATGVATGPVTFATAGLTNLTATVIGGNTNPCACIGNASSPVNVTVQPQQTCTVTLSPPAGTVTVGQPTTFTATVLCNGVAVPGATVAFSGAGGTVLATGITGPTGAATGSVTFATAGPTTVTASVTADTVCNCMGVSSSAVNVTVQPQQTCSVVLSPPAGTVTAGQPTNLTATVLCNGVAVVGAAVSFTGLGGTVL
ncbi:hypothetical protein, partial [Streptomyces kronopolitis]